MKNSKPSYWQGIDGLRSVAFLMVFLHHCGPAAGLNRIVNWGWLGVDLFFVISGFLITSLLLEENFKFGNIRLDQFYMRRILRIWPPYYCVLIAACLVSFQVIKVILPDALFIGNFYALQTFNYLKSQGQLFASFLLLPLWSLCIEEQFYIFLPLTLIILKSVRKRIALLVGVIVCSIAYRFYLNQHSTSDDAWYFNTLAHLDPLMIGSLLGMLNFSTTIFNHCKGYVFATCLAALAATTALPDLNDNHVSIVPAITWCSIAFAGILACACSWKPAKSLFSNKFIAGFGRKTYSMYLWHGAIVFQVQQHAPSNWALRAALSLVLTYLVAELSWKILEAPINSLKGKFTRKLETKLLNLPQLNESASVS
jgi:peptidoglycan/LPS O-acetylase OafA/YrhL